MNNSELNDLIKAFVALPSSEKPQEIISSLREVIVKMVDICRKYGVNTDILLNREMVDVNKDNVTTDDYYEAIFAYLKSLEDAIGRLLIILSKENAN